MGRETIIAIARYIEDDDCICKHCGSISDIAKCNIAQQAINNGKPRWRVECPECDGFIRWAATEKIKRVWFKGEMHQIGELETGLLMWMLSKGIGHAKYIYAVLKGRMGVENVPDIPMRIKKAPEAPDEEKVLAEMEKNYKLITLWQDKLLANLEKWDATEVEHATKNIRRWQRKVINLQKKLPKIGQNQDDPNQLKIK